MRRYSVASAYVCARTHLRLSPEDVVWRDETAKRHRLRGHTLVWVQSAEHYQLMCDDNDGETVIELVPVRSGRVMGGTVTLHVPRQLLIELK